MIGIWQSCRQTYNAPNCRISSRTIRRIDIQFLAILAKQLKNRQIRHETNDYLIIRIKPVAQTFAEQVTGQNHDQDSNTGESRQPPLIKFSAPQSNHRAPLRSRWRYAQTKEAQG